VVIRWTVVLTPTKPDAVWADSLGTVAQRNRGRAAMDAALFATSFERIVDNVGQIIQGKSEAIRLATICLIAEGHLLIEDVPGVGKTSLAKALAASLGGKWNRIQFTPDLLPSDVTGVTVFSRATNTFEFRPGGIFANIVLGDEINRASPKTQAAMLEAMEERQVTADATTYALPSPFLVIATQNPIEHEGTYPLPEAQLDRFLMKVAMGYPIRAAEIEMLDTHGGLDPLSLVEAVVSSDDVEAMIGFARTIHVAPSLKGYIVDLATASRRHPALALGMSPRACLALQRVTRARAAAIGREYVVPDDIKAVARNVLGHRLVLTPEAALAGNSADAIIEQCLDSVPVPTTRQ
jgi:MoxR-like ATPase